MATSLPRVRRSLNALPVAGFIDVETTGLNPARDEVVEFAIALFAFRPDSGEIMGIVGKYAGLRDPGRPIPKDASAIHGIRDADVRGKRLDERRIRALLERAEFFVAHNASFDRPFVERLFPEAGAKPWYCSMNGVPWKELGFASRGLQNLLRDHGIRPQRAHRGLDDVEAALLLLARTGSEGKQYFQYVLERYGAPCGATHRSGAAETPGLSATAAPGSGSGGRAARPLSSWLTRLLDRRE